MCLVVTCTPTGNNIVVSELHVVLRAPLRRQAADGAHAALVVDAEVQRERGQHHLVRVRVRVWVWVRVRVRVRVSGQG